MSSSVLRIFAIILAIGAIAIGYFGFQASQQPPKQEPVHAEAAEPKGETVVFAARDIKAGQLIGEEDLKTAPVPTRPVRSYESITTLIGQKPKLDIAAGEMVMTSHFPSYSPLSLNLQSGERAVAVKVDEVIGTGGFIEPGDQVDVLLYLHTGQEVGKDSSAQVVLSKVRVLAFGNMLEPTGQQEAVGEAKPDLKEKAKALGANAAGKGSREKKDDEPSGKKSKTAVLAILESQTSTLMLAESSGNLRLALHGVDRGPDAQVVPDSGITLAAQSSSGQVKSKEDRHYIKLRELILNGADEPIIKAKSSRPKKEAQVIVHRGSSIETISPGH